MVKLEELMKLESALAAFEFNPKGELISSIISDKEVINERMLDLLCHVCVANGAIATMQARGWEAMTDMQGFYPIKGFSLIGFEWTVVVNDCFGVIAANDKIDFDAAYQLLDS